MSWPTLEGKYRWSILTSSGNFIFVVMFAAVERGRGQEREGG